MSEKKLIVLDSNSLIHRAFHALPPLETNKGEEMGAVYGFLLAFFKVMKDFSPDYVIACFDYPAPTFRHKRFKEYKAERPAMPKELKIQIPKVKEALEAFGVPVVEKKGFEADDLIGSITKGLPVKNNFTQGGIIVITGDLDLLQLVDEQTRVYLLRRGIKNAVLYDKGKVREKYSGIVPIQLDDLRALKGDSSDNIPGVPGIGRKTAIQLLKKFSDIESLYENIEKVSEIEGVGDKTERLLIENKEQVFLSKELAEIKKDVKVNLSLEQCQWGRADKEELYKLLEKWRFKTLADRLSEVLGDSKIKKENLSFW
ncbi:MAG: hypothetical protein GF370_01090 [Candidatus Nealsonbacteria bacterium]|nr:hypothetical protein [Candidatus Nealsonbacteria bacterium]